MISWRPSFEKNLGVLVYDMRFLRLFHTFVQIRERAVHLLGSDRSLTTVRLHNHYTPSAQVE